MAHDLVRKSKVWHIRNAVRMTPREAFSLFEVAISLAIVALSVTSVLLLFPMGVKTQQQARFRLYAAAKAQEMVESFAASHNANSNIDAEAMQAWDVPVGYRATHPDLETRLSTHLFGIMPLPMTIARRLDSDNDEIQKILDEGGYLYYSQPQATTNLDPTAYRTAPPNEAQKLVFAVTGYAQNNAVFSFPWKAWPYYVPWPSPPVQGIHKDEHLPATAQKFTYPLGPFGYCWETASDPTDPHMAVVFDHGEGVLRYGYRQYAYQQRNQDNTNDANRQVRQQRESVIRYVQSALWYAKQMGMPSTVFDPASTVPLTDFVVTSGPYAGRIDKQVLALRYLAHAAMCLTRWYSLDRLGGQPSTTSPTPTTSVLCDAVMLNGVLSPKVWVNHDKIIFWHESAMNLAMLNAASNPYDWGTPRPLQRATMMDYPLIEWDLSSTTNMLPSTALSGASQMAAQWRPLSASPVVNANRSYQFPEYDFSSVWSTNADKVTLTAPFDAWQRCRQIVFWAVDWQAYNDFETAPSAPVDASKYPIAGPLGAAGSEMGFDARMGHNLMCDPLLYMFRNPEKLLAYNQDVSGLPTGANVSSYHQDSDDGIEASEDQGVNRAHLFNGVFGADRNCNLTLDRGPLPITSRMRAMSVGRFNFYDPRVPLVIR